MKKVMKKRLVVIGNGMAGVATLEEIIKLAPERYDIAVFGKERHLNYNRVLLTDLLTEEKTLKEITLNDVEWYEENGIKLHSGCAVKSINRAARTVVGEDGSETPYDTLVIATGSKSFIPPIEGVDKDGVFSFRNVGDCERIRASAGEEKKAVVIGGGLLGLEAARGMLTFGMDVTVVHLMDRLMERQLDERAAAYLKEDLEGLGIKVLLSSRAERITGNGHVTGVTISGDESVEADLVVMAAGIMPNTDLARESGVYCERGIVVSDTMQTYDPSVYAVGECTENRGETFGLVAQVFDQARVLGNHLAGDAHRVFKNHPVSTRLKIPGIELYSAGSASGGEGVETIEYHDSGMRAYKRLFLKDNKIEGIVMYGDVASGPTLFEYLLGGTDISEKRMDLFSGGPGGESAKASISSLPDSAVICGCNGITKGMVVDAVKTKGLFTLEDVKKETKASTSCGGCSGVVEQVLESVLGSNFQIGEGDRALCGCTKYGREDIVTNIREKRLTSVAEVMETLGWETVGCEECRPAINYYVAMVWPTEAVEDPTSRLVNERVHANIQKDETFSVVPRMYGGVTTPSELKRIAEVAEKFDVPLVKVTGGQRLDLLGIEREKLPDVWKELDMPSGYAYGKALRTVKTCVGSKHCRYGTQDSLGFGIGLEKRFEGLWMPAKVKLGVTGCPRNCAESTIKDVGVVGISGGFDIYVGGCGGIKTRAGELLCTVETEEEAAAIIAAFIQHYREEADYGERSYRWVERRGLEKIKAVVVGDLEERAKLCLRIDAAAAVTKDPWTERIHAAGLTCSR